MTLFVFYAHSADLPATCGSYAFETHADDVATAFAKLADFAEAKGTQTPDGTITGDFDPLDAQAFVSGWGGVIDTAIGPWLISGGLNASERDAKRKAIDAAKLARYWAWKKLCNEVAGKGEDLGKCSAFRSADVSLRVPLDDSEAIDDEVLRRFMSENPRYWVAQGYEGSVMWLFAKEPTTYKIRTLDMYHRGGTAEILVNGESITIDLDLD